MAFTTISKHTDYFNTVLYTGNGSTQSITGVGHQPDFTWIKNRSTTHDHILTDVVRGVTKDLRSNNTDAEATDSNGLTAFGTDGFTVGSKVNINNNGSNIVSWNWKAGGGQGSANTDGTINTTYTSANTTSGFSIIKYTGTGSNGTVGHGLGVAPKMVIVKVLDNANDWMVGHEGADATNPWHKYCYLNGASVVEDAATFWNDTAPTSSVVSLGTHSYVNYSGRNYIMYAFADKVGFSQIGRYYGTGSATNGPFISTTFKPQFVLFKRTTGSAGDWQLWDTKRDPFNPTEKAIHPNASGGASTDQDIDILSNGFKIRSDQGHLNADGVWFLYMAFGQSLVGSNNTPCTAR